MLNPDFTMSHRPPVKVLELPRRDPYYVGQQRDSDRALMIAEQIADTHLADYRQQPHTDIAGLASSYDRAWFRALGAFALRYCRRAWRIYAYDQALDQACRIAEDVLGRVFLEPSKTDPSVLVKMDPRKVRAMLGVLANEIIKTYVQTLDGTIPVRPGEYVRLEEQERGK